MSAAAPLTTQPRPPRTHLPFRAASALLFLAVALLLVAPALGQQRLLYGRDTIAHDYLMHLWGWNRQILPHATLPLWCPHLFLGIPFLGSLALCPFYPTQLLYALLPFNTAFTLQYALALATGGLTAAWCARQLPVRRPVALWAGGLFLLSGHFLTLVHAGHLQKMEAIAWAPAALGAAWRIAPGNRPRNILILAAAFALQALASHPQILYATAAACALLILARSLPPALLASPPSRWQAPRIRALNLAALATSLALAFLLAAAQLLPLLETTRVSNRANGVPYPEAVETSYPPLELLEYAIPSIFSDSLADSRGADWQSLLLPPKPNSAAPAPVAYFGKWGERIVSDYLGIPALLLAAIGLCAPTLHPRDRLALALLIALSLLIAIGDSTPAYRILYNLAPGFRSFRSPGTFMFIADLALVLLAAIGLEELLGRPHYTRTPSLPRLPRRKAVISCLALLLVIAIFAQIAALSNGLGIEGPHPELTFLRAPFIDSRLRLLALEAIPAFILLAIGIARWQRRPTTAAHIKATLLALLALALPLTHNAAHYLRFDDLPPFRDYLEHQPLYAAAKSAARASTSPTSTAPPPDASPTRVYEENALSMAGMMQSVATQGGYHPVMLARYARALAATGTPEGRESFLRAWSIPFLRSSQSVQAPGPSPAWTTLGPIASPSANLWRLADTLPFARVDTSASETTHTTIATPLARVTRWSDQQVTLRVTPPPGDAPTPNLTLIIAQPYAPGWKLIPAKPSEPQPRLFPTDQALTAAKLPPIHPNSPAHDYLLRYDPFSFRLGLFASLATTSAILALTVTSAFRRKPSMVGPPGFEPGTSRL